MGNDLNSAEKIAYITNKITSPITIEIIISISDYNSVRFIVFNKGHFSFGHEKVANFTQSQIYKSFLKRLVTV